MIKIDKEIMPIERGLAKLLSVLSSNNMKVIINLLQSSIKAPKEKSHAKSTPKRVVHLRNKSDTIKKEKKYYKTLRPTSEELKLLNLHDGENSIKFEVITSSHGKKFVEGSIYVYPYNTKIVISDVDGTITISDVLGHIMYIIGQDYSHKGVADLYTAIQVFYIYILRIMVMLLYI